MKSDKIERIRSNLEELSNAYNTIELYGDAIEEALELMNDCDDIVHCVDCKNRLTPYCPVYGHKFHIEDDWYCDDGERW